MTRDYAAEIRDRMRDLGRLLQPRHARLVGDPNDPFAICRLVYIDSGAERYAYTFGRCAQDQWIADSITDRRIQPWLRRHGLTAWVDDAAEAWPLLVAVGDSDAVAALNLEKQITGMKRWLRGNDAARLVALARFIDEPLERP